MIVHLGGSQYLRYIRHVAKHGKGSALGLATFHLDICDFSCHIVFQRSKTSSGGYLLLEMVTLRQGLA